MTLELRVEVRSCHEVIPNMLLRVVEDVAAYDVRLRRELYARVH
jgi:hypothetical protein